MATVTRDAWGTVVGQDQLVSVLRQAVRDDAVGHAFMLIGDAGLGQVAVARALTAALNCDDGTPEAGCGECAVCARILRGVHPALIELEPDGAQHVVSDVRDVWIPAATVTMTEGRRRVIRIVDADRMNVAAQNALLKLLEEPPPSVVWLLDARTDAALLDTVLSRCQLLRLRPFDAGALQALAVEAGVPQAQHELLVALSGGSPVRLQELADEELFALRLQAVSLLSTLRDTGPVGVFGQVKSVVSASKQAVSRVKAANAAERDAFADAYGVEGRSGFPPGVLTRLNRTHERRERAAQRHALTFFLAQLHTYLRDVSLVLAGVSDAALLNRDCVAQLHADAAVFDDVSVREALTALKVCEDALARNGAAEVQLERLLLRLSLAMFGK